VSAKARRAKTASTWGTPPRRYYRFLERVERAVGHRPTLTVVGCADGKFVLPAARRGWNVQAVDIDPNMIDGCPEMPEIGVREPIAGLRVRLETEGLTERVLVQLSDFMTAELSPSDALWTSGSLQHPANASREPAALTVRLRQLLHPGGLAYIEYMLPEDQLAGQPHCPTSDWWQTEFPRQGWRVFSHRLYADLVDAPHPYKPWAHTHSWGRMIAARVQRQADVTALA
jgi:SAM-dependent methyltransferase